ncbi:MAG TPA: triose-phosphate isomerase [Caulobacterales bacterium]|nr:triose-phosphate isomerase [Caulobacterales bacterium]
MASRKPLIAGNWKMHGRRADLAALRAVADAVGPAAAAAVDILFCPPVTLVAEAAAAVKGLPILVGAQDCAEFSDDGPYTGEVSAPMLKDAGASHVIVGHSERRAGRAESDTQVRIKAETAALSGLAPIVCVGETLDTRLSGAAGEWVGRQLAGSLPHVAPIGLTIAYEPIWCVGTDRIPTTREIEAMHAQIRGALSARFGAASERVRVLYGGSVSAKNAAEILAIEGVDGVLVGRASLNAADFAAIIKAHPAIR